MILLLLLTLIHKIRFVEMDYLTQPIMNFVMMATTIMEMDVINLVELKLVSFVIILLDNYLLVDPYHVEMELWNLVKEKSVMISIEFQEMDAVQHVK